MDFKIKTTNAKNVKKMLDGLPQQIQKNVVAKTSRKIIKPATLTAKRNIRPHAREFAKSIGVRQKRYKNAVSTVLGPRSRSEYRNDRGTMTNPTKIAHLLEYGTKRHIIGKKKRVFFEYEDAEGFDRTFYGVVNHPGTKGRYFMRKTWRKHKNPMFSNYANEAKRIMPEEAVRYAKRVGAKK